jgi:cytoskeleton protein RodZ
MSKQATRRYSDGYDDPMNDDNLPGSAGNEPYDSASMPEAGYSAFDESEGVRVLTPKAPQPLPFDYATTDKSPGILLREGREKLGLSLQEIADRMFLDIRIIKALEADDHHDLPPPIFVQGYLRGYARLVDIPANAIIQVYQRHTGNKSVPPPLVPTSAPESQQESSGDSWYKILTFIIVLALAALIALWQQSSNTRSGTSTGTVHGDDVAQLDTVDGEKNVALPPVPGTPPADSQPAGYTPPSEAAEATAAATPPASPQPGATPATAEAAQPAQPDAATPAPAGAAAANPLPAEPNIKLSFRGASWTEVTDSQNKKLLGRVVKAGESLTLQGTPPFKMVIGKPGDTSLEYQGKTVDLGQYKGVARFTLGGE